MRGKGGDILYRFGNPQVSRQGDRKDQVLFCQHSAQFLRGVPGDGNILVFNNGRAPDRQWSTVDEYSIPDEDGEYLTKDDENRQSVLTWKHGPSLGRLGSYYCTHSS